MDEIRDGGEIGTRGTAARRWRRAARWMGRGLLGLIGVVVLVLVLFLTVRPLRESVLIRALDEVRASLPGSLELDAAWPGVGLLELSDVRWTDGADTLLTLETFHVGLDLSAALRRELHVREVRAAGARADLDAISRVMAAEDSTASAAVDTTTAGSFSVPWFATGRLAPLPAVRLDRVRLEDLHVERDGRVAALDRLELGLDLRERPVSPWLRADLRAHAEDLGAIAWGLTATRTDSLVFDLEPLRVSSIPADDDGASPEARLRAGNDLFARLLAGESPELRWDGLVLSGDAGRLRTTGRTNGRRSELDLAYQAPLDPAVLGRALAVAAVDTMPVVRRLLDTWPTVEPYTVEGEADLDGEVIDLRVAVLAPGPTALLDPQSLPLALPPAPRLRADLDLRRDASGALDVDLSLARSTWLDRGRLQARWSEGVARVDTLDLARPGLEVVAHGDVGAEDVDARLRFAVDSTALAGNEVLIDSTLSFHAMGEARLVGAWPLPRVEARFDAGARGSFGEVEAARVRLEHDAGRARLAVRLAAPAQLAGRTFERADLRWEGVVDAEAGRSRGRASLGVAVDDLGIRLGSALDLGFAGDVRAAVDTLRLTTPEGDLSTIETFTVSVDTTGEVSLRSLAIRSELGDLRAEGTYGPDALVAEVDADLVLARSFLERVLPDSLHASIPADSTRLRLEIEAGGPLRAPSARLALDVGLEGERTLAPLRVRAGAWLRGEGSLPLPGAPDRWGSRGAALHLTLEHAGRPWLDVEGDFGGRLDLEEARFVRAVADTARVDLVAHAVDLTELERLAGRDDPIRGALEGRVRAEMSGREVRADADLRLDGLALRQSSDEWWESDVVLLLRGNGDLDGRVELDSLRLRTAAGSITGRGQVTADSLDVALRGDLVFPRLWIDTLLSLQGSSYEMPSDSLGARLDLVARGPLAAPSAQTAVDLRLRGGEALHDLDVRGRVWLAGAGDLPGPAGAVVDSMDPGVLARLQVSEADSRWVDAEVRLPLLVSARPPEVLRQADRPFSVSFDTGELEIARLATLADMDRLGRFAGDLRMRLDVRSDDGHEVVLDGAIRSSSVRADLVDGSWAQARADVRFSGTGKQPRVDGGVTVEGGVIRLPDPPPSLHPSQGEALLWDEPLAVPTDSSRVATVVHSSDVAAAPDSVPGFLPEVDVTLSIPQSLRLVGMGLDIELSGSLDARTDGSEVNVIGTLQATRGSYQFLGRRFVVQTGRVQFYGDLDPELDLRLSTTLGSTTCYVQIRGTAQQPRFELSSDPSMSEGDIVSTLLFGRPLDELDEGQSALLRQRTQEVATQLGATLLAQRVGQQVGVDILSVQAASDGEGQALVVGKYLSPDVLVQYEQVLEEGAAALVRLEYALTRFLKIETTASQGDHSGVELKWSRDY